MTAEEEVKAKFPEAYCNNWPSRKGLRWWVCVGVYESQQSIGPKRLTPDEAWEAAASRLTAQRDELKRGMKA